MTTNNRIQHDQLNQAHRNKEDLEFRMSQLARIIEPMATDTCKVINKKFWDKYFMIPEYIDSDGHTWKARHEFELSDPRYHFEAGKKRIHLGRSKHPTRYDGTPNDHNQATGDWFEVLVPNTTRLEILEALRQELAKLTTWHAEKLEEIAKLGQVDEEQLRADLIAVYEKHGRPARVWDELMRSRDLSSYNLND